MATIDELKAEIAKKEKVLGNAFLPDPIKNKAKQDIDKLKKELKGLDDESKGEKKEEKKKKAPKTQSKKAKKEKAPAKPKAKRTITFEGEEIDEDEADYCEKLLKAWKTRREKAKKSAKKHRTRSVTSKIATDISQAVEKGVESVPAKEIADNPEKAISKFERLEKAALEFLDAFKSILGDKFKKKDAKKEFGDVEKMITDIKKKFKTKMAHGGYTQGYDDRQDESLGMRTGAESTKEQDYKARREDSYGKWGKRDAENRGTSMAKGGKMEDETYWDDVSSWSDYEVADFLGINEDEVDYEYRKQAVDKLKEQSYAKGGKTDGRRRKWKYDREKDLQRKAKPVGYRFKDKIVKGKRVRRDERPTQKEIEHDRTFPPSRREIYYEARWNRADEDRRKRLDGGGEA